jgi:hypothetical protein
MTLYQLGYKTWPIDKVSDWKFEKWSFDAKNDDEARKKIRERFGEPEPILTCTSFKDGYGYEMTYLNKSIPFR